MPRPFQRDGQPCGFSFDVLPSSLIDNMMIYKSPSAELPADFSGGFVRVLTKNIPEGNTLNVSYQVGFNTNSAFEISN